MIESKGSPTPQAQDILPLPVRSPETKGGRTLGPVVATYEDIWEAYDRRRTLGREFSVTGHIDGYCIRKWIDCERN